MFKPKVAWMGIFAFIFFSILLILAGAGSILNFAFPLGGLAVGILLYYRAPVIYVGFTWWLWFLAPFIRRLSDWRGSYTDPSPILFTPYLVTLITLITLWKNFPKAHRQGGLPFLLSIVAIIYGILVGLIYRSFTELFINGLDWLVPVIFGFHLFVNWRNYPNYRRNIQQVFFWGVLVMGVYGVFQFMVSPPWDVFWLSKSGFESGSVGRTENFKPFTINVWSTMTSNRPFATVMMAGLILLFINQNKGKFKIIGTIAGYLSFLLARKRTVWGSWLVSLLIHTSSLKKQQQIRTIISLIFLLICVGIAINLPPFSDSIFSRLETFGDIESDASGNFRLEYFLSLIDDALLSFFGKGIGGMSHDSGILSTLFDIGWLGTIFYFGGMLSIFLYISRDKHVFFEPFVSASRSIVIGVMIQFPLGRPHIEVQGMVLWTFLSMAMAAKKYYQHQLYLKSSKS